jgi:hypothetical protein
MMESYFFSQWWWAWCSTVALPAGIPSRRRRNRPVTVPNRPAITLFVRVCTWKTSWATSLDQWPMHGANAAASGVHAPLDRNGTKLPGGSWWPDLIASSTVVVTVPWFFRTTFVSCRPSNIKMCGVRSSIRGPATGGCRPDETRGCPLVCSFASTRFDT